MSEGDISNLILWVNPKIVRKSCLLFIVCDPILTRFSHFDGTVKNHYITFLLITDVINSYLDSLLSSQLVI